MKNFWLERKNNKSYIQLKSSYGVHLEFVDLSHQTQHNSRYKEYDRLKERWNSALEPFDFESKGEHRGINLQTKSGHTIEMIDEPVEPVDMPPWNTSTYQGFDIDEEQPVPEKIAYPEIYGFKTPEKHTIGYINEEDPPQYTKRWKRLEIMSSTGFLIMKDDNLPCGQWAKKEQDGRKQDEE